jgi:hypothetical protein
LKDHHRKRAVDVGIVLDKGRKSAYQVTSEIRWDLSCVSWDLVPILQRWFAAGGAIARLKYLEEKRIIGREMREQRTYYLKEAQMP